MKSDFPQRLRARKSLIGYWIVSDNVIATERLARLGYDFLCLDLQHGLIEYSACVRGLMAIDAGEGAGVVRVPSNDAAWIGRALDAGARAVIVPMVNTADEVAHAVRACRYAPMGARSYGPLRPILPAGSAPREADESVACIVMIETQQGLDNLEAICATTGLDAVFVGPYDLAISMGADRPPDHGAVPSFDSALERVRETARQAGVAAGIYCIDGRSAAARMAEGFTFVGVANDLNHLQGIVQEHLAEARRTPPTPS